MTVWQARLKSVRDLLDMYEIHMNTKEYNHALACIEEIEKEIYTMRDFK